MLVICYVLKQVIRGGKTILCFPATLFCLSDYKSSVLLKIYKANFSILLGDSGTTLLSVRSPHKHVLLLLKNL